jgi:very-short-patch-repair endonuclease
MRPKRSAPKSLRRTGSLRRSLTPAEAKLWEYLRAKKGTASRLPGPRPRSEGAPPLPRGVTFKKRHPIGQYVVDFCAPRRKLVIELDGSQHVDQADYDARRTEFIRSQGYHILRVWNSDVENSFDGVIRAIVHALDAG